MSKAWAKVPAVWVGEAKLPSSAWTLCSWLPVQVHRTDSPAVMVVVCGSKSLSMTSTVADGSVAERVTSTGPSMTSPFSSGSGSSSMEATGETVSSSLMTTVTPTGSEVLPATSVARPSTVCSPAWSTVIGPL